MEIIEAKSGGVTLTMNQVVAFIMSIGLTLATLAYSAGAYGNQFTQMKSDLADQKIAIHQINESLQSLTIQFKEMRQEIVNQRH